jgi:ribosomal protein S18 acetylase RimI-like enzyme
VTAMLDRLPPGIVLVAPLVRRQVKSPLPCRNASAADLPELAELLVVSYRGTVDDLNQTTAEALQELEDHTTGEAIGPMLWDCSFVALDGDQLVSTVLTCESKGRPHLPYIYTHPDWQSRGLATALIQLTTNALLEHGYDRVALRVSLTNQGARRLYERLEFVPE